MINDTIIDQKTNRAGHMELTAETIGDELLLTRLFKYLAGDAEFSIVDNNGNYLSFSTQDKESDDH